MSLELNKVYHGFKLVDEKELKEIHATGRYFEHEKSGAKLAFISNEDDNKVFCISFRTPPEDSTGIAHILEHSVLCGSRKFPIKEPFVELAKGSLNTFLNAMTYPDKTMYPVASCNETDFINLMDVYMDAVLYPNIYKKPEIFEQEGWHYQLENLDEELTYKGVVYNEMKGAYSSPDQFLFRCIKQSLYPDTPYANDSGGTPEIIPELTYEAFLDFHNQYYHPSNSYIYLYGNCDVLEKLEWLNENYLKDFDKKQINSELITQKSFEQKIEIKERYPISSKESEKDKTYLSYNFSVDQSTNKELNIAFEILEYMLLEAPGAPLKRSLIKEKIGKDIFGSYDNSIKQPIFSIVAKNSSHTKKDKFIQTIHDTLKTLAKNGINKRQIEGAINYHEFKVREADYGRYPKGLIYGIMMMGSWLYDEDPFMHLEYDEVFEKIKKEISNNYFENLIEDYLINNKHATLVVIEPEKGLTAVKENEVKQHLAAYKSSLSESELQTIIKKTEQLAEYQNTTDSKEDLESLPILKLKDIKKEVEKLPLEEKILENVKWLLHPTVTNQIAYINLAFDTKYVPMDLIPYIGLLSKVLGKMDTSNYTFGELANEINIETGGIRVNTKVYGQNGEPDVYQPKFEIRGKGLYDKASNVCQLIEEIILRTDFSDVNRLHELITETKSRLEMTITSSGHTIAVNRAQSYYSPLAYYKEMIGGIDFYDFIDHLDNNFDTLAQEIVTKLKQVVHYIFKPEHLLLSTTTELEGVESIKDPLVAFIKSLDTGIIDEVEPTVSLKKKNEGLLTPGKIQYVAKVGNFMCDGYKYVGSLRVLQTIVSLDYLWNTVRVKGGAYGCMTGYSRNGDLYFVSYRDPNIIETIAAYDNVHSYISTFSADEREMTKYIIGTISSMDTPLTPSMIGERALNNYLSNISFEDRQEERNQILATTQKDIQQLSDLVKSAVKQDNLCVLGNENKIEKHKNLFDQLMTVIK